jgi:4-alpha-glucanotransferase
MKFINEHKKIAGLVVPLIALRRNKTAACGVFSDLVHLARVARQWGLSLIQLLPLNDTGNGTSPYAALSAFALNPIYISLSETPDTMAALGLPLGENAANALIRADSAINRKFGGEPRVPYEATLRAKLDALRQVWNASREICAPLAEALAAEQGWAKPYASFVALKEAFRGAPWWDWPEWREITSAQIDALWYNPEFAEEARFRLWLQVLAREQLQRAAQAVRAMGIDIMGDIPILLAKDSADVWFQRDIFILNRQAGAPPDMYSPRGQNWGFPLYDWEALRAQGYAFWRQRLGYADNFYTAYRIDHVLGFFRIWAIDEFENDAYLGVFEPSVRMSRAELSALGFSDERIRWLSKPHVPEWKIQSAEKQCLEAFAAGADRKMAFARGLEDVRRACFVRIKDEPLFLFSPEIRGTSDISVLFSALRRNFPEADRSLADYARSMGDWWIDRVLYEAAPDAYVFQWSYRDTTSWKSLSPQEQAALEAKAAALAAASLDVWERRGRELLSMLESASDMQPFAEDLGAVPPCVPKVLRELNIPGLKVLRWERRWDESGQPYIPFGMYEPLSVACTSVHDSTNMRQWWEEEADRRQLWAMFMKMAEHDALLRSLLEGCGRGRGGDGQPPHAVALSGVPAPSSAPAPHSAVEPSSAEGLSIPAEPPKALDTAAAAAIVRAMALSSSIAVVYPVQDILACHPEWREPDPRDERINVPGTTLATNWTYRMPVDLHALAEDKDFSAFISNLVVRTMPEGDH